MFIYFPFLRYVFIFSRWATQVMAPLGEKPRPPTSRTSRRKTPVPTARTLSSPPMVVPLRAIWYSWRLTSLTTSTFSRYNTTAITQFRFCYNLSDPDPPFKRQNNKFFCMIPFALHQILMAYMGL